MPSQTTIPSHHTKDITRWPPPTSITATLTICLSARSISAIPPSTTKYHSDGVPRFRHMTREDNGMFLKNLTEAFNNNSRFVTELGKCYKVDFINEPPHGYASYITPDVHGDKSTYGHPISNNEYYHSYDYFAEHVFSIIKRDLDNCGCTLCEKVRGLAKLGARNAASLGKHHARKAGS
ncbi:hypothetical protein M436DRAFT_46937 [Aureobasidium namibiae CBS 147.97]|uniref:Cryptic loci regulator 2 N-terminal domain-containing protein n=1 Tax=Aureobasidium namibiae CBS 147.97 TaxID=1043004 RepID=A0A074WP73_9PEZI|nr:uncharacterized protein M436DRAFT_46937 [Aureobasidium namibiae CBS 147.97]KEQ73399.1 hypothetical protein M436DRAFT_46937 [Aureobasidium namibiae CBS 147.97]